MLLCFQWISVRQKSPWFNDVALDIKHEKCRLEKIWKRSRVKSDLDNFKCCVRKYRELKIVLHETVKLKFKR